MFSERYIDKVSICEDTHIVIDGKKESHRHKKDIVLCMTHEIAKELIQTLKRRIKQYEIVCVNLATGSNLKGNPILGDKAKLIYNETGSPGTLADFADKYKCSNQ